MPRFGKLLLVAMPLALVPQPTHAFTVFSGNDLHELCSARLGTAEGGIDVAFCTGYIRGAFEQLWAEQIRDGTITDTCIPDSVTNVQIIDIVKVYLRDNPAKRHDPAMLLVQFAMRGAFPDCF